MNIRILFILILTSLISCSNEQETLRIYTIGDSTMASKKAEVYPETGWGQVLNKFFDDKVEIHNHAVNGRSSKSFITEGRWKVVLDSLKKGDFVFIQFGHNDQKAYDTTRYTKPFETYSENLSKFISESREKGAIPVLFTSIVRRKFDENGQLLDTHLDYPVAMRQVAEKMNVPLVDLQKITAEMVQALGDEKSKELYMWIKANENFPEGRKDDTHLRVEGARKVASLATTEIKKLPLAIAKHVVAEKE